MSAGLTVTLSKAQARALLVVAEEGYTGLASDHAAAAAYLGGPRGVSAAARALDILRAALARAKGDPA